MEFMRGNDRNAANYDIRAHGFLVNFGKFSIVGQDLRYQN